MTQHFHHLQSGAGLTALENHSCELLGFSRLVLATGESHSGSVPTSREILLAAIAGKARVSVNGKVWFLAGDSRRQGAKSNPSLAWTQKLVGMV